MTLEAADLADLAGPYASAVLLVFLRVGGAMAGLPAFGEPMLPRTVRLALAIGFTLVIAPMVIGTPVSTPAPANLAAAALAEVAVGVALGLVVRGFVFALQTAGAVAAQAGSLAQMLGGFAAEPMPALGHLFVLGGLCLAVTAGLHVTLAAYLVASYDVVPRGVMPAPDAVRSWGVSHLATSFALALRLAAPFVIGGLLYNLGLAAINRAMPQLMVSLIGAPALALGTLAMVALAVPAGLAVWHQDLLAVLAAPFGVAR